MTWSRNELPPPSFDAFDYECDDDDMGPTSPPDIKVFISVADTDLVDSKLLTAKITIQEDICSSNQRYFMSDFVKLIDKIQVEVSTASDEFIEYLDLNESVVSYDNVYDFQWDSEDVVSLDCTIKFEYRGKVDEVSTNQVEVLLASGKESKLQIMESMLHDTTFVDFTFNVRDRKFSAHKIILAAASDVMRAMMFSGGLKKTRKNSATVDCDPEIFAHLIKFIYANSIPVDQMPKICIELHELAHLYNIGLLEKICLVYIKKMTIDADNALQLYELAATYKIEELRTTSWDFIKT